MDRTPSRISHSEGLENVDVDGVMQKNQVHPKIRKPPPVTPRRFTKFFTPRPRNAFHTVRTSRNALRTISSSALNTRRPPRSKPHDLDFLPANENVLPRKRRKVGSEPSTPKSATSELFLPSSQEPLRSSPIRYGGDVSPKSDLEKINEESEGSFTPTQTSEHRIRPYRDESRSRNLLCTRLSGKRPKQSQRNVQWQSETAGFYTGDNDINTDFTRGTAPALPFSVGACHTNPIVATGDEDGWVRLIDTGNAAQETDSIKKLILEMKPHDNALMDLNFSPDDSYLATASGDQSCQVIDVHTQKSLYTLRSHTSSVKRIQFQPGSGNKVLASCGRDGQICFWDLRTRGGDFSRDRKTRTQLTPMAEDVQVLRPVNVIGDAHTAGSKYKSTANQARPNNVPGRNDFSITSLSFLGETKSHLIVTASEVDTVVKIWDMRISHTYSARSRNRLPTPISSTQEPESHEYHRRFGINSIALSTDCSRLYALSRDHTVYAYSTAHLILGSNPQICANAPRSFLAKPTEQSSGLGPIYGFRHPMLRVSTFWPRLAIRKASDTNTELLAVGSTDDCAILFPTNERYLVSSNQQTPALHSPEEQDPSRQIGLNSRPRVQRANSSSFSFFDRSEESLPIYCHGTPLIRGHIKEVTSLTWSSEGNLVTASDDWSVRCWRENPKMARMMRTQGAKDAMLSWRRGWADVGLRGYDDCE